MLPYESNFVRLLKRDQPLLLDGGLATASYQASREGFSRLGMSVDDAAGTDVIALETIPSLQEAEVLSELLGECETPSWISFSCRDEKHICDGTSIADVAKLFVGHPTVIAVGINCTPPQYAAALISELRMAVPDKFVVAYPNSGETYNVADNSWSGTVTPGDCATAAGLWIEAGAKVVGGCCRMGPEHISAMASLIRETCR